MSNNMKNDMKYKIQQILSGTKINFHSIENKIFKNNMFLVDSYLHFIIAEILILHCLNKNNIIAELVKKLAKKNPLLNGKRYNQPFYERKLKEFLYHLIMGMNSNEIWNGKYDASKHFFIKGNNNELITYNIYNRNQFEDYLYQNTRLETASSTRHKFGIIYKDLKDNCFYMKLNLQIRFK